MSTKYIVKVNQICLPSGVNAGFVGVGGKLEETGNTVILDGVLLHEFAGTTVLGKPRQGYAAKNHVVSKCLKVTER